MKTTQLNNTIKKQFNQLTFNNRSIKPKLLFKGLERLLEFYESATNDQINNGLEWYKNERKNIVNMKRRFNYHTKKYKESALTLTTENVCEIVSILSPLLLWDLNKLYANKVLYFYSRECIDKVFKPFLDLNLPMIQGNYMNALSTLDSLQSKEIKRFAYKPKKYVKGVWNNQYHDITHTKPFIQPSGLKTLNFKYNLLYANIVNPYVTIDSHMTNCFFNTNGKELINSNGNVYGYFNTDNETILKTWLNPRSKLQYDDIGNVIKLGAKLTNNKTDQFQAIVWNVASERFSPVDKKHLPINPIKKDQLLSIAI
jgi:hypothetical protein